MFYWTDGRFSYWVLFHSVFAMLGLMRCDWQKQCLFLGLCHYHSSLLPSSSLVSQQRHTRSDCVWCAYLFQFLYHTAQVCFVCRYTLTLTYICYVPKRNEYYVSKNKNKKNVLSMYLCAMCRADLLRLCDCLQYRWKEGISSCPSLVSAVGWNILKLLLLQQKQFDAIPAQGMLSYVFGSFTHNSLPPPLYCVPLVLTVNELNDFKTESKCLYFSIDIRKQQQQQQIRRRQLNTFSHVYNVHS